MIETMWFRTLIKDALTEDIGPGDVTTLAVVDGEAKGEGEVIAKEDLVLSGADIPERVFRCVDKSMEITSFFGNGDWVKKGNVVFRFRGRVYTLLKTERVMLNILQRLSGIATLTRKMVNLLEGTNCKLLDTRKTTPLWRVFEKAAVRHGGGRNHRFGLFDGVLIKDNHIVAAGGSISEAVRRARSRVHHLLKVEVEVESLRQLEEAIGAGVDMVLLDNFSISGLKEAVTLCRGRILCEASGGMGVHNLRDVAETGVDFISCGVITHSAPAVDMSFKLRKVFS